MASVVEHVIQHLSSSSRLPALQLLMQELGVWLYLLSQANVPLMTALLSQNLESKPIGGRPWASGSDLRRALLVRRTSCLVALVPGPEVAKYVHAMAA